MEEKICSTDILQRWTEIVSDMKIEISEEEWESQSYVDALIQDYERRVYIKLLTEFPYAKENIVRRNWCVDHRSKVLYVLPPTVVDSTTPIMLRFGD